MDEVLVAAAEDKRSPLRKPLLQQRGKPMLDVSAIALLLRQRERVTQLVAHRHRPDRTRKHGLVKRTAQAPSRIFDGQCVEVSCQAAKLKQSGKVT